ncbi:Uncharacterized protein QJS10_CPB18g00441 [Acorus calamus]|uniref:DUF2470 domain-containing protein n=1 Tax=Acorus calamus TaxID=4465 RepID=A0AAV9CR03_ACOCL|nr:Uncharacterized protein QJS10_CPB18g00441 [Acorus calamus]
MAIGFGSAIASPSSLLEGAYCSTMNGTVAAGWIKPPFDSRRDLSGISFRHRSLLFGTVHSQWLSMGQESSLSKVHIAANHSEPVPDSPKYVGNQGYHPLEELKNHDRSKNLMLSDAQIARSTVQPRARPRVRSDHPVEPRDNVTIAADPTGRLNQANSHAMLVFPGELHNEPHGHETWAEFEYVVDDYGDIFIEIFHDENILNDRWTSNPVHAFIGMDIDKYLVNQRLPQNDGDGRGNGYEFTLEFDHKEIVDSDITDTLIDRGMPETLRHIHPIYFVKCLTQAVHSKHERMMDHPSNGLSIMGFLTPADMDEEYYVRSLFNGEDNDVYNSDWRDDSEREAEQLAATYDLTESESTVRGNASSIVYKLEIVTMNLFSVYGNKASTLSVSSISGKEFHNAEPDILAHSALALIDHFNQYGTMFTAALKALCRKKKHLDVERASLIGIDSLGMDVRVFSGLEAHTLRFPFNTQVKSESAAEKKIRRMLFPRYHRKNHRTPPAEDEQEI